MNNPKQNPNELLHENAQEASYLRDKKLYEKNSRLKEEQSGLDRLNREIEDEARIRNSRKAQLRNEQYQEYTNYFKQKYEENQSQKRSKHQLTEKIGGENRQIVRKTYDEISNGLCLNPMKATAERPSVSSAQQTPTQQRSGSHGYNIISNQISNESTKYQTGASLQAQRQQVPDSEPRGNQGNYPRERGYTSYEQQRPQPRLEEPSTGDYYQDQMNQHNLERIQPLKPTSYQEQPKQDYPQMQQQNEKEPELTEEDYKRYYEYLDSLRKNENHNPNSNEHISANHNINQYPQEHQNQQPYDNNLSERGMENMSREKEQYIDYMQSNPPQVNSNNQYAPNSQPTELENQMHQLSLQEEARNEYLANKQKNRSSFSNLSDGSQPMPQEPKPIDKSNPNSLKQDKQRMYREYLDNQINAKNVYKQTLNSLNTYGSSGAEQINHLSQANPQQVTPLNQQAQNPYKAMREKNSKFNDIPSNPYSNKNYNFGSSALGGSNPISNPVNSYKAQPSSIGASDSRQVGSGRLRNLGSNIMNQ